MLNISEGIICSIKKLKEFPEDRSIVGTDQLATDLGFTSMEFIKLIVAIEEHFDIELEESNINLRNFKTVQEIEALVSKYLK
jgi:acyl carrier protein